MKSEKTAAEIESQYSDYLMNLPMTFRCTFCEFIFEGSARDGLAAAKAHRELKHPHARRTRKRRVRSVQTLGAIRTRMLDEEEMAEINAERRRRAAEMGIELSESA